MKSIIIIIPYFGSFPSYFSFWLQSAYNNPTIDFIILTDNNLCSKNNVRVIQTDFAQIKKEIQEKLDIKIKISSPYKLCDFKATYGFLFPEYIKGYDYWGFGDLDLVYGDIRHFYTDDVLTKYDVISGWGHLTLYKNTEYNNQFFKTKIDGFLYFDNVFKNPKYCGFDEYNHKGLSDLWKHLHPEKIWDNRLFDDVRVPRLSFNFFSEFHPEHSNHLIFEYRQSNLFRVYLNSSGNILKEETLYAHFQQRKFLKVLTDNHEHYLIVPNAFIKYEEITLNKLKKWCRVRNVQRKYWNLKNSINRRIEMLQNMV